MRDALPRAGGLANQDAQTMLLLDVLRETANGVFAERIHSDRQSRDLESWRSERARERRGDTD